MTTGCVALGEPSARQFSTAQARQEMHPRTLSLIRHLAAARAVQQPHRPIDQAQDALLKAVGALTAVKAAVTFGVDSHTAESYVSASWANCNVHARWWTLAGPARADID